MSVAILRLPDGQDYSKYMDETEHHGYDNGGFSMAASSQYLTHNGQSGFLRIDSFVSLAQMDKHPSDISLSVIGKKLFHWHCLSEIIGGTR
jgi:hypothetical protein